MCVVSFLLELIKKVYSIIKMSPYTKCYDKEITTKNPSGQEVKTISRLCLLEKQLQPMGTLASDCKSAQEAVQEFIHDTGRMEVACKAYIDQLGSTLKNENQALVAKLNKTIDALTNQNKEFAFTIDMLTKRIEFETDRADNCERVKGNQFDSMTKMIDNYKEHIARMKYQSTQSGVENESKYIETIKKLEDFKVKCEERSQQLEAELKSAQKAMQSFDEMCMVDSTSARKCVRRIKEKFPQIVALMIDTEHQIEGMITKGGKLLFVPPDIRVPIATELIRSTIPAILDTVEGEIVSDIVVLNGLELPQGTTTVAPKVSTSSSIPTPPPMAPPMPQQTNIPTPPPMAPPMAPPMIPNIPINKVEQAPEAATKTVQAMTMSGDMFAAGKSKLRKTSEPSQPQKESPRKDESKAVEQSKVPSVGSLQKQAELLSQRRQLRAECEARAKETGKKFNFNSSTLQCIEEEQKVATTTTQSKPKFGTSEDISKILGRRTAIQGDDDWED